MVIIDKLIQANPQSGTSFSYDLNITSQDAIIVVMTTIPVSATFTQATFNGNNIQENFFISTGNFKIFFHIMTSPPVGTYPLIITVSAAPASFSILSILGVDKSTIRNFSDGSYLAAGTTLVASPPSLQLGAVLPGSLIFDVVNGGNPGFPNSEQYRFFYDATSGIGMSARYGAGNVSLGWQNSLSGAYAALALPPKSSPSIWNPNVDIRNPFDVLQANDLDSFNFAGADSPGRVFGAFSQQFFLNSFLHTVGRVGQLAPASPLPEVERQTSQIIIDKVFQGQVAGNGIAAGVLNLQVNIPSQDAVLVVTGGSVIATGTNWASVQLNGDNLIQLVQASVAGADAEIWVMWNPPVGTYTLQITGGNTTAEVYANAMVLLGVDKTNTNVIVASATDAANTTTIQTNISPDAANSLIIDAIATLDATANPIPDQSQNQVFNATAINNAECVLSTYKLSTVGQQNMNYNLSAAVNAALVAVAFRPAHAISLWFPGVTIKTLDDVVDANALDANKNPAFGRYGYQPTEFYKNSFLNTIGREFNTLVCPNGYALSFDGVQNYLNLGTMGSFGSNLGNGFYCQFDIQTTFQITGNYLFGIVNNGSTTVLQLSMSTLNELDLFIRDQNGLVLEGGMSSTFNFTDGIKHTVIITANPSTNTITMTIDGNVQPISYSSQQTPATFANFGFNFVLGARNRQATVQNFFRGIIDNFQIGTSSSVLFGNYTFPEGTGPTTVDSSGNSNTGTLTGTPPPGWVCGFTPPTTTSTSTSSTTSTTTTSTSTTTTTSTSTSTTTTSTSTTTSSSTSTTTTSTSTTSSTSTSTTSTSSSTSTTTTSTSTTTSTTTSTSTTLSTTTSTSTSTTTTSTSTTSSTSTSSSTTTTSTSTSSTTSTSSSTTTTSTSTTSSTSTTHTTTSTTTSSSTSTTTTSTSTTSSTSTTHTTTSTTTSSSTSTSSTTSTSTTMTIGIVFEIDSGDFEPMDQQDIGGLMTDE